MMLLHAIQHNCQQTKHCHSIVKHDILWPKMRCWRCTHVCIQDENFPASLGNDHNVAALHCKVLLMDLLKDVRAYLIADSPWESYAEQRLQAKHHPYVNMLMANMSLSGTSQLSFAAAVESYQKADPAAAALRRCYRNFSRLSVLNERLGLRSGYTKGGKRLPPVGDVAVQQVQLASSCTTSAALSPPPALRLPPVGAPHEISRQQMHA